MLSKLFFAPKAFIIKDNKVLVIRESATHPTNTHAGEYSLIGGRIGDEEPWQEGFAREVKEEIGSIVKIIQPLYVSESFNKVSDEKWHIIRCFFLCELADDQDDQIVLSTEHDHFKWINPANFRNENIISNEYGAFEAYLNP